jgi:Tfp pilus assembly protein PilE
MRKTAAINARGAFTILELLCVIVIIFLLMALLMPALSRVRRIATRTVCASYLMQHSKAGLIFGALAKVKAPSGVFSLTPAPIFPFGVLRGVSL